MNNNSNNNNPKRTIVSTEEMTATLPPSTIRRVTTYYQDDDDENPDNNNNRSDDHNDTDGEEEDSDIEQMEEEEEDQEDNDSMMEEEEDDDDSSDSYTDSYDESLDENDENLQESIATLFRLPDKDGQQEVAEAALTIGNAIQQRGADFSYEFATLHYGIPNTIKPMITYSSSCHYHNKNNCSGGNANVQLNCLWLLLQMVQKAPPLAAMVDKQGGLLLALAAVEHYPKHGLVQINAYALLNQVWDAYHDQEDDERKNDDNTRRGGKGNNKKVKRFLRRHGRRCVAAVGQTLSSNFWDNDDDDANTTTSSKTSRQSNDNSITTRSSSKRSKNKSHNQDDQDNTINPVSEGARLLWRIAGSELGHECCLAQSGIHAALLRRIHRCHEAGGDETVQANLMALLRRLVRGPQDEGPPDASNEEEEETCMPRDFHEEASDMMESAL